MSNNHETAKGLLTPEIQQKLLCVTTQDLTNGELIDAMAEALQHCSEEASMLAKLLIQARHVYLWGYWSALCDVEGIQQALMRGEIDG